MSHFICGTNNHRSRPDEVNTQSKKSLGPINPNVYEWETTEVLQWLKKIDQAEYSSNFQASNTNGPKLLRYTPEDLKKLGIADLDDRKKIKKEIAKLNRQQNKDKDNNNNTSKKDDLNMNGNLNSSRSNRHKSKSPMNGSSRGGRSRDRDRDRDNRDRDNRNNNNNNNIDDDDRDSQRMLSTKSKSDYNNNSNSNMSKGGNGQQYSSSQIEYSSQPPYGRGGFDSDTFADEKKLDKSKYYGIWQSLVGNQEILNQTRYNIIMKSSNLPQQDLSIIWRMATNYNSGRCQFEQFADICKLLSIALYSGVPLYLINTQKLIWYHPDVPTFLTDTNHKVNVMASQQAKHYMVAFRGLPLTILESDDRLMRFAELALQDFEPVHFEINETTLIATFKNQITPPDLQALREKSIDVIQNKFGIMHQNGVNIVMLLQVEFPSEAELGVTPGGMNGGGGGLAPGLQEPMVGGPHGQSMLPNMGNGYPNHGGPQQMGVPPRGPGPQYGGQPPQQSQQQMNGYRPSPQAPYQHTQHPTPYTQHGGGQLPPPPAHNVNNGMNGHHQPQPSPHIHGGPQQTRASRPHITGQTNGYSPVPTNNNPYNQMNGHQQRNPNGTMTHYQQAPQIQQPQQQQQQQPPPQQTPQSQFPSTVPIHKKQEMLDLLLHENFHEEFRRRTNIDQLIPHDETRIRTKAAMSIVAALRQVPLRSVQYLDPGVKELQQKTKAQLRQELNEWTLTRLALLLGIPEDWIPEVYKGIIIEGLPDLITADDDTIRQLDSQVLFSFIVSHIEVVDNVLRITFKKDVSQQEIDKLRRGLKTFLKDIMKIDKKLMKCVSLIPHTRETWRGETTSTEYDDMDPNGYEM